MICGEGGELGEGMVSFYLARSLSAWIKEHVVSRDHNVIYPDFAHRLSPQYKISPGQDIRPAPALIYRQKNTHRRTDK